MGQPELLPEPFIVEELDGSEAGKVEGSQPPLIDDGTTQRGHLEVVGAPGEHPQPERAPILPEETEEEQT